MRDTSQEELIKLGIEMNAIDYLSKEARTRFQK